MIGKNSIKGRLGKVNRQDKHFDIGDIWIANLDDAVGSETEKIRPAVVFAVHPGTSIITVAPFTKNMNAKNFAYTWMIRASERNGLDCDCVALVFQIRCADTNVRLLKRIGMLDPMDMGKLFTLLHQYLKY